MEQVTVVGAGLAGCEAAWQIAKRGIDVLLYEMKPVKTSPAHHMDTFAELVCSNSLRSDRLENAVGLLKEEMRRLGSLIISCADETRVPAGGALAVDRSLFSQLITKKIETNPHIRIIHEEVKKVPEQGTTVIATGPLTSEALSEAIGSLLGSEYLYFYDAAAPIVAYDSIDMTKAFRAGRYGRGAEDYINCPMDKPQYEAFWNELVKAEVAGEREFEKEILFEGCMPVESMAKRGIDTLRYGPMKPVGLRDPSTGKEYYAVVQLRQDNIEGSMFNMVGFQTRLKWPEQKRVFSMIPALENAEFVRYGVMHRNTYINSPGLLDCTYSLKSEPRIYFAGQITGVEGYVESASSGLAAGINAAFDMLGKPRVCFPRTTAIGSLAHYISQGPNKNFQPMNVNFSLMEELPYRIRNKKDRNIELSKRALNEIENYINTIY